MVNNPNSPWRTRGVMTVGDRQKVTAFTDGRHEAAYKVSELAAEFGVTTNQLNYYMRMYPGMNRKFVARWTTPMYHMSDALKWRDSLPEDVRVKLTKAKA